MIASTSASVAGPIFLASCMRQAGVHSAWRRCALGMCSGIVVWRLRTAEKAWLATRVPRWKISTVVVVILASREWWAKVPNHAMRIASTLAFLRWARWAIVSVRNPREKEPQEIKCQYVNVAAPLVVDTRRGSIVSSTRPDGSTARQCGPPSCRRCVDRADSRSIPDRTRGHR